MKRMGNAINARNVVAVAVLSASLSLLGGKAHHDAAAEPTVIAKAAAISSGAKVETAGRCPELFIRAATVSLKKY